MKYTILTVAIALSLFPVLAEQPQVNPKAQEFVQQATQFIDSHSNDMPGFDRDQYISELNAIAGAIDPTDTLSNFNIGTYMDGVDQKANEMLGQLSGNAASLKGEYLEETANFFLKEYAKDMKNGVDDISTSDYLNDLGRLNSSYASRAAGLNSPPPSGTSVGYDPINYLDKAAGATQRKTDFDFVWGGIQNSWLGYNLVSLVQAFQQTFAHDAVAQADFQFLLDLWPQSAEAYLMNTAYDEGAYYITNPNDPEARENNYVISEYGAPTSEYSDDEFDLTGHSTQYITASYNNRQWGYTDGTFNMVTIKTNGSQYSLAENFYTSPLVLDMDGDKAIEASGGKWLPHTYQKGGRLVEFDMNGDNFVELCEWVGPNDGLLIVNKGTEVSGNDLFGNAGGYDHGYEKLSLLDKNGDRQISGEELATLSVWQDKDSNAQINDGEVKTAQELGITMISLDYDRDVVSHFMQNGQKKMMVDWFPSLFSVKKTK